MEPSPNELNNAVAGVTQTDLHLSVPSGVPSHATGTVCRTLNSGMISRLVISPFIYLFTASQSEVLVDISAKVQVLSSLAAIGYFMSKVTGIVSHLFS